MVDKYTISKDIVRELVRLGVDIPPDLTEWAGLSCSKEAAIVSEDDVKPDIKGDPIPEHEVVRGSKITKAAIHTELEKWRADPELAKFAPTEADEKNLWEAQ